MMEAIKTLDQLYQWTQTKSTYSDKKNERFIKLLQYFNLSIPSSKVIKIAGTNGKGSVAAMLESIILADQKSVILFTSPHLYNITERFRINGQEIDLKVLDEIAKELTIKLLNFLEIEGDGMMPSFFEILTIIALQIFQIYQTDFIILEAGIGGYNDATHLIPGDISAITSIGLDHTDKLGSTVAEIAADKVGIASPNSTLIVGADIPELAEYSILKDVKKRNIKLIKTQNNDINFYSLGLKGYEITITKNSTQLSLNLPLIGIFQVNNFITAKTIIEELINRKLINDFESLKGVSKVNWVGRMEVITGNPTWIFDAAHNSHAIKKLTIELSNLIQDYQICLLLGLSDHNYPNEIIPHLSQLQKVLQCPLYLTSGFYRSIDIQFHETIFRQNLLDLTIIENYKDAINHLFNIYQHQSNILILVTGSLFLVGECRQYLFSINTNQ